MVDKQLERLARSLASSKMPTAQIAETLGKLRSDSAVAELIHAVERLREQRVGRPLQGRDPHQDMVTYVQQVLLTDSKLTVFEAVTALRHEFRLAGFDKIPAWGPKDSFPRWLQRVSKGVPPSDVMHFASRVSQAMSSGATLPWRLKSTRGEASGDSARTP
jgi:hypothetical protein